MTSFEAYLSEFSYPMFSSRCSYQRDKTTHVNLAIFAIGPVKI